MPIAAIIVLAKFSVQRLLSAVCPQNQRRNSKLSCVFSAETLHKFPDTIALASSSAFR